VKRQTPAQQVPGNAKKKPTKNPAQQALAGRGSRSEEPAASAAPPWKRGIGFLGRMVKDYFPDHCIF
jgi:hypothetical protein